MTDLAFKPLDIKKFEAFCWLHMQGELKHPIKDFHRELLSLIQYQKVAIAAPRGFAKSSYFSYFYPLFIALERPGSKIMLISATGDLANSWIHKIRNVLENNETIKDFYGPQEGNKWTSEELLLKNGSHIFAKGSEKAIRGIRPDFIIADDLETDEMVLSAERRNKFDHWFWTDLMGTLLAHAQCIVIGTILHPESFLTELIKEPRHGWTTRLYQAIKEDGSALWPDQWPLEVLERYKLEYGVYAFQQEFMNDPIPDDLRKFQEKWFKYYSQDIDIPSQCVYFTMVDPAIETEQANDCTAIVTCAVDKDLNIYVVDVYNKRSLPTETISYIFDIYNRYKPATIGIESIGFMKLLHYEIERERKRRGTYPVISELKSGGRRKSLRIEAMQPWFEQGKVYIKESMQELKTQLLRFPSTRCHDDVIDALAYLLDIIRPASETAKNINPKSFLAVIERKKYRKQLLGDKQAWGNHNLRNM